MNAALHNELPPIAQQVAALYVSPLGSPQDHRDVIFSGDEYAVWDMMIAKIHSHGEEYALKWARRQVSNSGHHYLNETIEMAASHYARKNSYVACYLHRNKGTENSPLHS